MALCSAVALARPIWVRATHPWPRKRTCHAVSPYKLMMKRALSLAFRVLLCLRRGSRELVPQGLTCEGLYCCGLSMAGPGRACASCKQPIRQFGFQKSPWQPDHSVPKLPYLGRVEANPGRSRIRSQYDAVSATRPAPRCFVYPMPREASVLQHWDELC